MRSACGHEFEDGAYVLGASSPVERSAFERHLSACGHCQKSVRRLAGLPGLLARVPVEVVEGRQNQPPVPDTLLPRLLRRARRAQRRRTATVAVLAAAVVAVGGIGIGALTRGEDGAPSANPSVAVSTAAAQELSTVGDQALSGWVSLTPVGWGTRLDLTCSYAADDYLPREGGGHAPTRESGTYTLVVTRRDGVVEPVTSWNAQAGRTMHVSAGTAAALADISEVSVRRTDGTTALRLLLQKPGA